MSKKSVLLSLGLSVAVFTGCSNSPEEPAASTPAKPVAAAPASVSKPAGAPLGVAWDAPAEGLTVVKIVKAGGVQIYECKKTDTGFAWALKAPEAILYDDKGRPIGSHSAGPTWEVDGVKIVAEKVAEKPQPNTIPWLLLKSKSTEGTGPLAATKYVKRIDTTDGLPPGIPADASNVGKEYRVQYGATYVFYAGT